MTEDRSKLNQSLQLKAAAASQAPPWPSTVQHTRLLQALWLRCVMAGVLHVMPSSSLRAEAPANESVKREEISFQHGAVTLSGDLLKPTGPGPFPVFVWCHGSGKADRKWGLGFSSAFVKAGYAFLTWDKPGVGKSGGSFYMQSLTDRAKEVRAAAEMLMQRSDIDAGRVSFCGASQAGYVLPRVIKAFPQAERLVLIGPGSWSFGEELAYQRQTTPLKKYLPLIGLTKPQEMDEFEEMFGKVYRAADADFVDAYLKFHKEAGGKPWYAKAQALVPAPPTNAAQLADYQLLFQEAFAFDAVQEYSEIHCPTLILFGEKDECVDPKVGIPNIRAGFARSGNTQLSVIVYPGASHSLDGAGDKPKQDLLQWLAAFTSPAADNAAPALPRR